jgi:hypothetical protein
VSFYRQGQGQGQGEERTFGETVSTKGGLYKIFTVDTLVGFEIVAGFHEMERCVECRGPNMIYILPATGF